MGQGTFESGFAWLNRIASPGHSCRQSEALEQCLENPPSSAWIRSRTRRWLEAGIALAVLAVLAAPMLLLAACIRLATRGGVLFSQERVGMGGRLFKIYKFRSMAGIQGPGLTRAGDSRVTALGRFLRRFKIDELPQLYNVLRGEMSLVGPRPKLPQYAALGNTAYRPGITGAATLAFRHEEELICGIAPGGLEEFYAQHIKPVKTRLDACYMCKATPSTDLQILAETLVSCMRRPPVLPPAAFSVARSVEAPARYGTPSQEGAGASD